MPPDCAPAGNGECQANLSLFWCLAAAPGVLPAEWACTKISRQACKLVLMLGLILWYPMDFQQHRWTTGIVPAAGRCPCLWLPGKVRQAEMVVQSMEQSGAHETCPSQGSIQRVQDERSTLGGGYSSRLDWCAKARLMELCWAPSKTEAPLLCKAAPQSADCSTCAWAHAFNFVPGMQLHHSSSSLLGLAGMDGNSRRSRDQRDF